MPIAVTAEQEAIAESIGQWAKRAGTIAAVRGLESTAGRMSTSDRPELIVAGERWASVAELGIFSIALPAEAGGAGGTVADVAVVAEQLAAVLAPGPLMPTLLAGLSSLGPGGPAAPRPRRSSARWAPGRRPPGWRSRPMGSRGR